MNNLRTRILLTKDNPYGAKSYDVEKSYNMTKNSLHDRNADMEIKLETGSRMILMKAFIAGILEIETPKVEKKEVSENE